MMSSKYLTLVFLALCIIQIRAYDETLAKEFVTLSFATYCKPARLATWDVGTVAKQYPTVTDVTVVQSSSNLAYVAYNQHRNAIFIAFRGSSNIPNWLSNLSTGKSNFLPACNCQVHSGFLGAYNEVKAGVFSAYNSLRAKHPTAQVHVGGHSLGAAMATLLVAELKSLSVHVDQFISLGSPRVGDTKFYNWFVPLTASGTSYRLTHAADPVPHLPPQLLGFYHINTEIFYNPDAYQCRDVFGEDPNCIINHSYNILYTSDHSVYIGINSNITNDCQ